MACNGMWADLIWGTARFADSEKLGYWGGISPEGKIAQSYKTKLVRKQDGVAGGSFTVVDADDAAQMYDDFYRQVDLLLYWDY